MRASRAKVPSWLIFFGLLQEAGLPQPKRELRFHPTRKWQMDYAWEKERVFLEVEGLFSRDLNGKVVAGRHRQIGGYLKDMEKYNEAAAMGYRLLRTTPSGLTKPELIDLLRRTLSTN